MDEGTIKYLSPVTVEAEIFLNKFESLSKRYNNIDVELLSTLEKIMNAIEDFLDSAPSEIVETKTTKLVKCDNLNNIALKVFTCGLCKRDIGKSIEKAILHIIRDCSINDCARKTSSEMLSDIPKIKTEPNTAAEGKQPERNCIKYDPRQDAQLKLSKKTLSLLKGNFSQFIEDQVEMGVKFKCIPAYEKIEKDLLILATPLFPNQNVQIYKFGSRIAGMGHRDSDLDLYMDIGETFNIYQDRADNEAIQKLHAIEKAIKNHSNSWKGLKSITKARVPIIKVIHAETGIECDINFSNSLGVINTKLLEYIFNLQPIAQSLCCYMKKWVNRIKLDDEINTYSMNLIVLFFLQNLNLIPSIERLQENVNLDKALKVGHWICTYGTYPLKDLNIEPVRVDQPNLLKYIRSFFVFYIHFNFSRDVICPYLGKVIQKIDLEDSMPSRYADYVEKFPANKLQVDKAIIVQDPLQLNHNTTKNVSSTVLEILRQKMIKSLQVLNDNFLEDVI